MSLFNSISTLSHHIKDMMWYKRTILIETCCDYRTLYDEPSSELQDVHVL